MSIVTFENGKKIRIKPTTTLKDLIKVAKKVDPEGSYPKLLKKYGRKKVQEKLAKEGEPGKLAEYIDSAAQGLSFGLEDELQSALKGATAFVKGEDAKLAYDLNQAVRDSYSDVLNENKDWVATLLEWGVPTGIAAKAVFKLGKAGIQKLTKRKMNDEEIAEFAKKNGLGEDLVKQVNSKGVEQVRSTTTGKFTIDPTKVKVDRLPKGLTKTIENVGSSAITAGSVPGITAGLGASKADQGERVSGGILGGQGGFNLIKNSPTAVNAILRAPQAFNQGGLLCKK